MLNRCAVCGRTATYHVELGDADELTPTFTGTPDTYLCATHVLSALIVDDKPVKGVGTVAETKMIENGSTAANRTFDDAKVKY